LVFVIILEEESMTTQLLYLLEYIMNCSEHVLVASSSS
jgi:hypothetical protein